MVSCSFVILADLKTVQLEAGWQQASLPCLWDDASILLQLGFLAIFLLHFVWKTGEALCTHRKKVTGVEKHHIGIKFGLTYKVSMVCSILLLGAHIMMLPMLQNRSEAHCKSIAPVLLLEITQVIIWVTTLLALYKIHSRNFIEYPQPLRT